jgi:phosphate transport system substrate-binding protein
LERLSHSFISKLSYCIWVIAYSIFHHPVFQNNKGVENQMTFKTLFLFLSILLSIAACQNNIKQQTYTAGKTKILVDESFSPIVEDEAYVFENTYPDAKLELINKPENEILKLFLNDSIRIAILSRPLTPAESEFYKNKKITIRVNRFAIDGIALITDKSSLDSVTSVAEIIKVLQGKPDQIKSLVFDNPNSSTVRYFKDLAGVKNLPAKGIYALKSNPDVIKYVHEHAGSIGVVGINWIEQPDRDLEKIVDELKVVGVKNLPGKPGSDAFYKPDQSTLALGLYPLTRSLYIINCQGGLGLGTGFASFLAGEQGQRVVLKSGLLPDSIPSREVIIRK